MGLSDFSTWVVWNIITIAIRTVLMGSLVWLGRTKLADRFRITKVPVIRAEQQERESVWPIGFWFDFAALVVSYYAGAFHNMPFWNGAGIFWMFIMHITIVEFLYYWLHRLLHVKWVYQTYHQYHHASINTEAKTCLSFEIGERLSYTLLFAIAPYLAWYMGVLSYSSLLLYFVWFDINNGGGHINFEFLPKIFYDSPLGLFWYSPSYHSIHHTRFKLNFSLFMPWPDLLFGTADMKLTKDVFTKAISGGNAPPSVIEHANMESGTARNEEEVFQQQVESQVVG